MPSPQPWSMPSPRPFRARARPAPISGDHARTGLARALVALAAASSAATGGSSLLIGAPAQRNTAGRAGSRRLQARSWPAPGDDNGPGTGQPGCGVPSPGPAGGATMDGWHSVEELTRWGFAHAPVVMANEAHDGLRRCVRTRRVGVRMVRAAHEAGVRRLAMEALPWQPDGTPGPFRDIPEQGGYLEQPDMRTLMTAALDLGWTLWAYEAVIDVRADRDPAEFATMEFTNWREREQAQNLCRVLAERPGEPVLV